jgi:hypothetical protein
MSTFVKALDNYTQIGENGHVENTWSTNNREKIVQLSFQLTRTDKWQTKNIEKIFVDLLSNIKTQYKTNQIAAPIYEELVTTLYKLIGQTRDIVDGKGEYSLAYMMLLNWYDFFPTSAIKILDCFVNLDNEHPYGSWKDLKYFADVCRTRQKDHPLINQCVSIINKQLRKDAEKTECGDTSISLVAKWIPREKSKFGWLFNSLAEDYYSEYLPSNYYDHAQSSSNKASLKCKTCYRKLVSGLNRMLDTVQIKQCSLKWSEINPASQTAITMKRQNKAFLNVTKKGVLRVDDQDRIICADNFKEHIAKATKGEVEIKGKRLGMNEFVKEAIELNQSENTVLKELLNAQWKNNSSDTQVLQNMIAMVDTSASMDGNPLYSAIGLGIRVAEKSLLGKRIMTFSAAPTWVNLDGIDDFVDMVKVVSNADWGTNTNFYAAMDLILKIIVQTKMTAEDVEDLTLAIFSDMQIDQADSKSTSNDMFAEIERKYAQIGMTLWGKPFKPPHILFWNLRSTSGFPTLVSRENTSMMSGFSPALLNLFCENGKDAFRTPWSMMMLSLASKRYNVLEQHISTEFL